MNNYKCVQYTKLIILLFLGFVLHGCASHKLCEKDSFCLEKESYNTADIKNYPANFCSRKNGLLRGGAFDDVQAKTLLEVKGIKTIINLQRCDKYNPNFLNLCAPSFLPNKNDIAVLERIEIKKDLGNNNTINYYLLAPNNSELDPLNYEEDTDNKVAKFLAIVKKEQENGPIYVHCAAGENRTGVMIAAYDVIINGIAPSDAIREFEFFDPAWKYLNEQYIKGLGSVKIEKIKNKMRKLDPQPTAFITCKIGNLCKVQENIKP